MDKCILGSAWVVLVSICPGASMSILSKVRPPTGEPDAGEPPVRFGGRGSRNQSALPTPIILHDIWRLSMTQSSLTRRGKKNHAHRGLKPCHYPILSRFTIAAFRPGRAVDISRWRQPPGPCDLFFAPRQGRGT